MIHFDFSVSYMSIIIPVAIYLVVGYLVMLAINLYEINGMNFIKGADDNYKRKEIIKSTYWSALFSWAWPYALIATILDKWKAKKALEKYRAKRDQEREHVAGYDKNLLVRKH